MKESEFLTGKKRKLSEDVLKNIVLSRWYSVCVAAYENYVIEIENELLELGYGPVKVERILAAIPKPSPAPVLLVSQLRHERKS